MIPVLGVPVLNKPDLLMRMLGSIDHPIADLLVIDNGDVVDALPDLPTVKRARLLKMPTNLGVPASWNLIIKALPFAPYWVICNSDAWFPAGSLAALAAAARRDALVLSGAAPPWACYALGDDAVRTVGLFDEGFYPAYFEDTDWQARARHWGVDVVQTAIPVHHDNSSTIREDRYRLANDRTFAANAQHFQSKQFRGDVTDGHWSLARRRALTWD